MVMRDLIADSVDRFFKEIYEFASVGQMVGLVKHSVLDEFDNDELHDSLISFEFKFEFFNPVGINWVFFSFFGLSYFVANISEQLLVS